jgi:hypothetical protein
VVPSAPWLPRPGTCRDPVVWRSVELQPRFLRQYERVPGRKVQLIGPLIEGLQQVPGGASISITSLLPPFAATRLYTFPCSWDDPNAGHQDCFFTALNFFREPGDTNFLNPEAVERALESDYAPIKDQPTYGDLVLLMSEGRECMHVCVYIADDFVFTKNGLNTLQPWVLMRLRDMLSYYPSRRRRELSLCGTRENMAANRVGWQRGQRAAMCW